VESADAASAYGHLPFLVIADELAQWPTTRAARALWEALVSGLPKRPDSRLAVLTTAGDPAHWSAKVLDAARTSERWRVSEVRGPLPWAAPDDLAEQARLLPASAYARLHLNRWIAAEDRLTSAEDLAACVTLDGPQPHDPRHRYVIGLDLGLKNDRTVLAVCHAEHTSGPPLVALDRLHVLAGTRERPVSLADVEAVAHEAATSYGAPIRLDPWQAVGLAQRLRARGVSVTEWTFSPVSVGRLAMTLHLLLREHRLALPDDPGLLDELAAVRLRETRPGVYRLDHDAGQHDDRAVALGLAALALTERAEGRGSVTSAARASGMVRTLHDARPSLPPRLAVRQAARAMPGGVRGGPILGARRAWDGCRSTPLSPQIGPRRVPTRYCPSMSGLDGFAMPQGADSQKAWWGVRYVSAVCSQAGFILQETPPQGDVYSLDGQVFIRSTLSVFVQVKCTSKPITRQRSYYIKAAWRKNWTDLDLPGYFVVVSVPPATPDWMKHGEKPWTTLLHSAAFWTRIDPLDPLQTSITVSTKQRLTVETLSEWTADLYAVRQGFTGGTP